MNANPENEVTERVYISKISPSEIRDIITILNRQPFSYDFTMIGFDELMRPELIGVVERVTKELDPKIEVNFKKKDEESRGTFLDFLSIISFPEVIEEKLADRILEGEKEMSQKYIYFCLMNILELKQRVYLGKFLSEVEIPREFANNEEIKALTDQLSELQTIFKEEHQKLQELERREPERESNLRQIKTLENEKIQLRVKLSSFKKKIGKNEDFIGLLSSARQLRESQEKECELRDKIEEQTEQLSRLDSNILAAQQRLADAESDQMNGLTAEERLSELRSRSETQINELDSHKNKIETLKKKFEENQEKLNRVLPSKEELKKIEKQIDDLEVTLDQKKKESESTRDPRKEEKTMIFKQQALHVFQRKSELEKENEHLENETKKLESKLYEAEIKSKENMGNDNKMGYQQLAKEVERKLKIKNKMKGELSEIEQEINILRQSDAALKEEILQKFNSIADEFVSEEQNSEQIRELEDFTESELEDKLKETSSKLEKQRTEIKPLIEDHKTLKLKCSSLQDQLQAKRMAFEEHVSDLRETLYNLQAEYKNITESPYHRLIERDVLTEKNKILGLMTKMVSEDENEKNSVHCKINTEIEETQRILVDLNNEREELSKNQDGLLDTANSMNFLKKFLNAKLDLLNNRKDNKISNIMLNRLNS